MTLAATVPSYPSYIINYGCQVTVFPADQINRIEVFRAPDGDTGTALGAQTSTTLKDTSKTWTVNSFVNATVQITSGLGSGQSRTVASNTIDTLTVTAAWGTTPDGTSVYKITGAANDAVAVSANVLAPSPLSGVTFIDPLPNDSAKRYYKSRHIDAFGNVSVFTTYTEALIPELISGAGQPNPMAAFGAIVDQVSPNTLYELRLAANYPDPDALDGLQTYIDFPANTNFMRVGQTPLAILGSTSATPIVVNVANHGFLTGDKVTIRGHLINISANGTWTVTAGDTDGTLDADHFSLQTTVGVGTGVATGHVVKLSLTIDRAGNLVVYAVIRAVQLIVTGISTFNGVIRSLAGSLFRVLQHSTTGEYNDVTVKRVMLQNNNVEVLGDVQTSIDGDGDGTKFATILGTHQVNPSTITSRSSASQGSTAGWTDPDGSSNGQNVLSRTTTGTSVVAAASRLWCRVSTTLGSDVNPDAWDDLYTLKFRVSATASADTGTASAQADVNVEYSTDGGSNWTSVGSTYSVTDLMSPTVFTPVLTVSGAPTQLRFRLVLTLTSTFSVGATNPASNANLRVYATTWLTDTYPITWATAVGGSYGRRGLKLPKMKQGQALKNPGLEAGTLFWASSVGTMTVPTDATKAHSGNKYMQITTPGASFGEGHQADAVGGQKYYPVTPGDVVTFGGWAYRESGSSNVHYVLNTYDAAFALVLNISGTLNNTAAWVQLSDTYTIPASGVAYVSFFMEVQNTNATVARFDDASLVIGTDDLPHAYFEPLDIPTVDAKAVEGEVEFVGGTDGPHALAYHDGEKIRPIARTLLAANAATSSSVTDFTIATCPVKARRMNKLGRVLRVRWAGRAASGGSVVTLKIAGTTFVTLTVTASQTWVMDYAFTTGTTGASGTLDCGGLKINQGTVTTDDSTTAAFDLTADFNIDFIVRSTSGTLTSRIATVAWEATQ